MSKTRLLSIAVIGLLLLNFGTLSVLLYKSRSLGHDGPPYDRPREPKYIVIERLHLDPQQQDAYQALIDVHRIRHHQLNDSSRDLKTELYNLLRKQPVDKMLADSLIREVAQKQLELEHLNFEHFQDVRALCRPEQLHDFDLLAAELADIFSHRGPPGKR